MNTFYSLNENGKPLKKHNDPKWNVFIELLKQNILNRQKRIRQTGNIYRKC
jgi:hypothetical protein